MPQTLLTLTLELRPAHVDRVMDILGRWRSDEEQEPEMYSKFRTQVSGLHFMSATVFPDLHFDPILAIEANTDHRPADFWQQLSAAYGEVLQSLIRCCKRPAGRAGALFDAAVKPGAMAGVAAFLHHASSRPAVAHQGHRGLDRSRIDQEAALFLDTQRLLAGRGIGAPATATELHAKLRAALLPDHPWLSQPAPARIPMRERLRDGLALALALALLLFSLSLPGLLLSGLNTIVLVTGIVCAGTAAALGLRGGADQGIGEDARQANAEFTLMLQHAAPFLATAAGLLAASVLFVALYLSVGSLIAAIGFMAMRGETLGTAWPAAIRAMTLGLASLGATLPLLLLWLRRIETADPAQDEPTLPPQGMASLEQAEDQIVQNHMASIVLIKPGILRGLLLRAGLRGLGLLLRVLATDGYLGSMRTIHFAQWSIVGNGSRLLFFSNYDGSWESYLDDFVEKAHGGLSLAWGGCVGFPPCRFLVLNGASHGRQFKTWARRSMAPAAFWFSAYPADTVNQIERQTALANGLRRPTLTPQEAAAWVRTL